MADSGIAAAEACFEWTRDYIKVQLRQQINFLLMNIKERKAFGAPIANLQTIRHKMAEMKYIEQEWYEVS